MQNEALELFSLAKLASRLRLPSSWLRDEAQAGRIPCLRIGRRLVFNQDAVIDVLLQRAASERQGGDE